MDATEVRMRCIEAATRSAASALHPDGYTAGALAAAQTWADWVLGEAKASDGQSTLHLKKK